MTALPSRSRAIAAVLLLLALAVFAGAWALRACAGLRSPADLSPFARRALQESPQPVHRVKGAASIVYATDPRRAAATRDEADYAVLAIARRLGVPAPTAAVVIVLAPGAPAWNALAREKGFRPDSLALNVGREILLRDEPEQIARPDRLAHELVHFVLRETYGDGIPLWLDEGLAAHLGFAVSRAYRSSRGIRVAGQWPGLPAARMESLDRLTSRTSLPDDPESAQMFYRASEELVAWIEERVGVARMREFVSEVASGAPWRAVLEKQLNKTPFTAVEAEEAVRQAVEAPKKR